MRPGQRCARRSPNSDTPAHRQTAANETTLGSFGLAFCSPGRTPADHRRRRRRASPRAWEYDGRSSLSAGVSGVPSDVSGRRARRCSPYRCPRRGCRPGDRCPRRGCRPGDRCPRRGCRPVDRCPRRGCRPAERCPRRGCHSGLGGRMARWEALPSVVPRPRVAWADEPPEERQASVEARRGAASECPSASASGHRSASASGCPSASASALPRPGAWASGFVLASASGCPSASASGWPSASPPGWPLAALARPWVWPAARSSSEPAAVGRPPRPVPCAPAVRRLLRPERRLSTRAARPGLDWRAATSTCAPGQLIAPRRGVRADQSPRMSLEPAATSPSTRREIAPACLASMPTLLGRAWRRDRPMQPFRPQATQRRLRARPHPGPERRRRAPRGLAEDRPAQGVAPSAAGTSRSSAA